MTEKLSGNAKIRSLVPREKVEIMADEVLYISTALQFALHNSTYQQFDLHERKIIGDVVNRLQCISPR